MGESIYIITYANALTGNGGTSRPRLSPFSLVFPRRAHALQLLVIGSASLPPWPLSLPPCQRIGSHGLSDHYTVWQGDTTSRTPLCCAMDTERSPI